MVKTCAAFNCTARYTKSNVNERISFHRFPNNRARRTAWAVAMGRKNWKPTSTSYLCSAHFSDDQFDRTSSCKVLLKKDAIPTIFEGVPSYVQHLAKTVKDFYQEIQQHGPVSTSSEITETSLPNENQDASNYTDSDEEVSCSHAENIQKSFANDHAFYAKSNSKTHREKLCKRILAALNSDSLKKHSPHEKLTTSPVVISLVPAL